jgi:hypothetical protein
MTAAPNGLNARPSDAARSVEYGRRISTRALTDEFDDLGDDQMDMDMSSSPPPHLRTFPSLID